jgi:hypothetical protein
MKKRLYLTRRQDFFEAMAKGVIPDDSLREYSSIWMTLLLTQEEKDRYSALSYPISDYH